MRRLATWLVVCGLGTSVIGQSDPDVSVFSRMLGNGTRSLLVLVKGPANQPVDEIRIELPKGDAEQAVALSTPAGWKSERDGGALKLQWTVAPGYYLYRHMLKVSVDSPAKLSLAPLQLPKGEGKQDPEFGAVEIYRGQLLAHIPLAADVPLPRTLRVRYQGCADIGVCYPPQTKLVAVP